MFTGLIEAIGRVAEVEPLTRGRRVLIDTSLAPELAVGDSLATNGVCLTVTSVKGTIVSTDVSPETLRVTTLEDLAPGALVNLERPMRADGRFGGHIVQGHVDGTGVVTAFDQEGEFYRLEVRFPQELARYFIHKGSVAVDGISLTIASLGEDRFSVQIIPQTWAKTNLQSVRPGREVNLECDLVGKYVLRAAELAQR
jgi:riboflavin synthase